MRSTLHLADGVLEWTASRDAAPERRPLDADAETQLRGWTGTYRRALLRPDPWDDLVTIGRQMYDWLDGASSWLGRTRGRGVQPPWVVDLIVPVTTGPAEVAFLEAP